MPALGPVSDINLRVNRLLRPHTSIRDGGTVVRGSERMGTYRPSRTTGEIPVNEVTRGGQFEGLSG
ncbi:hypothetical protein AArc1_3231 [Natrarchaeobaculum sulfurireducens]|uniref:Uncharacterized protein n=1 Tax=Natrarchaeobaculum sulfurireducens TaxID=2044521 RepID=A0A346PJ40_9EURY|nr:hypothetical protein AArc1_3231 [Natrarchaeobaculum sulfurireducens]